MQWMLDRELIRRYGIGFFILFCLVKCCISVGGQLAVRGAVRNSQSVIDEQTAILRQNPSNYDAYTKRGYAEYCLLRGDDAVADYSKALAIYPSTDLFNKRADAYLMIGKQDLADADKVSASCFHRREDSTGHPHTSLRFHKRN